MKPGVVVLIAVVAGVVGFFGGSKYRDINQQDNAGTFGGRFRNAEGNMRIQTPGGRQFSGRPVAGEILSQDENSITVKMPDGQSKIVLISGETQINRAEKVTKSELEKGVQVAVFGTENSDGSFKAQNIQLNPGMGLFRNITPTLKP